MKKNINALFGVGITLVSCSVASIDDLLLNYSYKLLNIDIPKANTHFAMITGLICILIAAVLYYIEQKDYKILSLIGLDSSNDIKKIKNNYLIDVIEDLKKIKKTNSKRIITNYCMKIDSFISDNISRNLSYYGIISLPFVSIAGIKFRKIKFNNHYEYWQKNNNLKKLNMIPKVFLPRLKEKFIDNNSSLCVLTIETTSRISNEDLLQFNNCSFYKLFLEKPVTNAIISELQLESYSEIIANKLYQLEKLGYKKIYILGVCQSSLMLEIFRKINLNRVPEIVVCNYSRNTLPRYNWGISIKKYDYNYVELKEYENGNK